MNKNEIITCMNNVIDWAELFKKIDDEKWFEPIAKDKWAIADIVSHLLFWDRYLNEERLPHIHPGVNLPSGGQNVEEKNRQASLYARSGISKENLIEEFVYEREKLVNYLTEIAEEDFYFTFAINSKELSLPSYLEGMIEHDQHHIIQIDDFLKNA